MNQLIQFNLKNMINKKRIEWFESSEQGILAIFGFWNRSKSTYKSKELAGPFHSNQTKKGKDPLSSYF